MYVARLVHFKLGIEQRRIAEKLTKDFDKLNRKFFGFIGNVYLFDSTSGEYRALNYWDTKDDAENAHKILFPKLENELKNYTQEKPTYKFLEVYDCTDDNDLLFSHIKL